MKKSFAKNSKIKVREPNPSGNNGIIDNIYLVLAISVVFAVSTGVLGFLANNSAFKADAFTDVTPVTDRILAQDTVESNLICLEIESKDKQIENEALQEENQTIKEASESIADTILDALMANIESSKLSSRSRTLDSSIKEARKLLDLQWKLNKFKKTEEYNLIDLSAYEKSLSSRLVNIPTLKPIPGNFPGYGWRIHPIHKYRHFHAAADQGAPKGTPVKAAASGYVTIASYHHSSGYYVIINHKNGFETTYMHHTKNLVKTGQWVNQGDIIGKVGSTGTATGPHLHFAVSYNGTPFDPRRILMQ